MSQQQWNQNHPPQTFQVLIHLLLTFLHMHPHQQVLKHLLQLHELHCQHTSLLRHFQASAQQREKLLFRHLNLLKKPQYPHTSQQKNKLLHRPLLNKFLQFQLIRQHTHFRPLLQLQEKLLSRQLGNKLVNQHLRQSLSLWSPPLNH